MRNEEIIKWYKDTSQDLGIELSVLFDKRHIVSNDVNYETATKIVRTTNEYEIYEPAKKLRISMALTKEELEK